MLVPEVHDVENKRLLLNKRMYPLAGRWPAALRLPEQGMSQLSAVPCFPKKASPLAASLLPQKHSNANCTAEYAEPRVVQYEAQI